MSRYVWNHSKIRGPDGKTSTVLPGVLDLMILGAEVIRERKISDYTCPNCMGTCVENVCTECGTIRPGPHSSYPRKPKDEWMIGIWWLVGIVLITVLVILTALWLVGYGIMNQI